MFVRMLVVACSYLPSVLAASAQPANPTPPAAVLSPAPDPLAPLPPLAPDKARVFFFRKPQFVGMAADARIALDGVKSGWVGGGSAVFVDHPAGAVMISIGGGGGFLYPSNALSFQMTLEPGKEYFVGLAARAAWVSVGGVIPFLITAAADVALNKDIPAERCAMDWCAAVFGKEIALPTLAKLSISGPNPNAD